MQERVHYTSWIKDVPPKSSYVGAGAFSFYGFRFFLCLEPVGFPDSITVEGCELKMMHHINTININLNNKLSQRIHFTW